MSFPISMDSLKIKLQESTDVKLDNIKLVDQFSEIRIDQLPEVRVDQLPKEDRWNYFPLYKEFECGTKVWQIGVDKDKIIIKDEEEITIINLENKEDIVTKARKFYIDKRKEGYEPAGPSTPNPVIIMKASEYKSIKCWPVYTQPKINGVRMMCQNKVRKLYLGSSMNNSFEHLSCYFSKELQEFLLYLPKYAILDGELYNHAIDFSTLVSAVKTAKTVHKSAHLLEYWIFDIIYEDPDGAPFEKRTEILICAFHRYVQDFGLPKSFRIVPTQVAKNHEDVLTQHNYFTKLGYEGLMIKKISNGSYPNTKQYLESLYKDGRHNHILKFKHFKDEEATVLKIDNTCIEVEDKRGNRFFVNNVKESKVSDLVTIRYETLSKEGIPINPIGIVVRNYE